ncbi:MAG TPA: hypothetical protein VFK50_09665 [Sphingomicrobium sp.]|nr:hypothetical protein [Sphingomicrobium sp.]
MRKVRGAGAAVAIALVIGACSSRPREFRPNLAAAPPSAEEQAKFDSDVKQCHQLLVAGKLDSEGRLASAGAGAAAGAATMAGGAALASGAGLYGGMAVASATVVLIPFAAVGGAWMMANAKRSKKEKIIQKAMAGCLTERGHTIVGWEKTGRKMKVDPLHKKKAKAPVNSEGVVTK